MKDDILIIGEQHWKAARGVADYILTGIRAKTGKFLLTIAGESGAGKSEIAYALANLLDNIDIAVYIIQQDDYFRLPPITNAKKRQEDIRWVGTGEVRRNLMNQNIRDILYGRFEIEKPLVIFSEDLITTEKIDLTPYQVILFEGTYTSLLENIDCRVFIDRNFIDTREDRLKRNREKQDDFLEQVLQIEHEIIAGHKVMADLIVLKNFDVIKP